MYWPTFAVAPARERGLKCIANEKLPYEIDVAPARERGLKCWSSVTGEQTLCRSREGAWIEILNAKKEKLTDQRRSREGAWIEIKLFLILMKKSKVSLPRGSVD